MIHNISNSEGASEGKAKEDFLLTKAEVGIVVRVAIMKLMLCGTFFKHITVLESVCPVNIYDERDIDISCKMGAQDVSITA